MNVDEQEIIQYRYSAYIILSLYKLSRYSIGVIGIGCHQQVNRCHP
jgi:hypothetical protein